jgi:hypothetical protein
MFKFYRNGKEITPPKRIKWYFAEKPDAIFESDPEKLEINANFWRKKLEVAADAEVVFVKSDEWTMDLPKITPVKEDECTTTTATTTNQPDHSDVDSSTSSQSDLFEDFEADVNTPKPKARKKAAKLSDVPTDLSGDDSASA